VRERRLGTGQLRSGQRHLGPAQYVIHVGLPNKPGIVVELESPPVAQDGEILELILDDGRVMQLQVCGVSPYCRVVGGRLMLDQRADTDTTVSSDMTNGRRRFDTPNALAPATRRDRRAIARAESAERRSADRLQAPTCIYCSTDEYVRSIRRTSDEVYFGCDGCEAMWAFPRPRSNSPHRPFESR
jgi:hypothetical protein